MLRKLIVSVHSQAKKDLSGDGTSAPLTALVVLPLLPSGHSRPRCHTKQALNRRFRIQSGNCEDRWPEKKKKNNNNNKITVKRCEVDESFSLEKICEKMCCYYKSQSAGDLGDFSFSFFSFFFKYIIMNKTNKIKIERDVGCMRILVPRNYECVLLFFCFLPSHNHGVDTCLRFFIYLWN